MLQALKKPVTILAGCTTIAIIASGCGNSEEATADDSCEIGMSIINQQDVFFTQMVDGAQEEADAVGCELTVANADNDPTEQASGIERFTTQNMDAIIANPIDVNGAIPAINAASDEGIPIISIDTNIGEEHYDSFVGVDNGAAAVEFAEYMRENGFEEGTQYGIVGAQNSNIQNLRLDEFQTAMEREGANMLQTVDGENQNELAATAAENLVTSQSDLDFIYTTGTPATAGAVSAVDSDDENAPTIVGWDLSAEIIEGIDSGVVQAVVQQDPHQEGVEAVQVAKQHIDGDETEDEILVPITIVTADNVDEFRSTYE